MKYVFTKAYTGIRLFNTVYMKFQCFGLNTAYTRITVMLYIYIFHKIIVMTDAIDAYIPHSAGIDFRRQNRRSPH